MGSSRAIGPRRQARAFRSACATGTILVAAALGACGNGNFGNPKDVADTTGETFTWTCASDGCLPAPETALVVTCGGGANDGFMYFRERFVSICPAFGSGDLASTYGELCRLVTCVDTGDCPQFAGAHYVCENGLCQKDGHDGTVRPGDVLELCLDGVARVADCSDLDTDPDVVHARAEVASVCGSGAGATCASVPADCRAP